MNRLYTVNTEHYANKKAAKVARGEATKPAEGRWPPEYAHTIQYGPDHWRRGGPIPGVIAKPVPAPKAKRTRAKKAD